tara:strand:+ start:593 stop:754 length:162 start_codon:yes stop_codon:yes gene_type:complete
LVSDLILQKEKTTSSNGHHFLSGNFWNRLGYSVSYQQGTSRYQVNLIELKKKF